MSIRRTLVARKKNTITPVFTVYVENVAHAKQFLLRGTNMFDSAQWDWVEVHRELPYVRPPGEPFGFLPTKIMKILTEGFCPRCVRTVPLVELGTTCARCSYAIPEYAFTLKG